MIKEVKLLPAAERDLKQARHFYAKQEVSLGQYCLESLLLDLERLKFFAGIHPQVEGYHRMIAKRFPFSIYYQLQQDIVIVIAILDNRLDASKLSDRLI